MTNIINFYSPRHRVTVKRVANTYKEEDITDDVVRINTSKVYGRAYGAFTLVLTARKVVDGKTWDDIIEPDDVVLIELSKSGTAGLKAVMLGLVGRLARTEEQHEDGSPKDVVLISGQDFGKLLFKNNCGWDTAKKEDLIGNEKSILLKKAGWQLGGTPAALVKKMLELFFFGQLGSWVNEYVLADELSSPDEWQKLDLEITARTGNTWSALKSAENPPYNTLYTYTGEDKKFHIGIEKTPYNNKTGKLERNRFYAFSDEDIIDKNVGKTDGERYNYIFYDTSLGIQLGPNETYMLFVKGPAVRYDEDSIERHGYIPFLPSTIFSPFGSEEIKNTNISDAGNKPSAIEKVTERTTALWNWVKDNHTYKNGDFLLHGDPDIKEGMGCLHEESNFEYFVEQVDHVYVVTESGNNYTAKLGVTRGMDHGK